MKGCDMNVGVEGFPIVEGLLTPDTIQVVIRCPYCAEWHFHGSCGGMPNGSRVPHCVSLPSGVKGYVIVTIAQATPLFMARIRREASRTRGRARSRVRDALEKPHWHRPWKPGEPMRVVYDDRVWLGEAAYPQRTDWRLPPELRDPEAVAEQEMWRRHELGLMR